MPRGASLVLRARTGSLLAALLLVLPVRADGQWWAHADLGSVVRRETGGEGVAHPTQFNADVEHRSRFGTLAATGGTVRGFQRTDRVDVGLAGSFDSAPWTRVEDLRLHLEGRSEGTRLSEGVRHTRSDARVGGSLSLLGMTLGARVKRSWFESGALTPSADGAEVVLLRELANVVVAVGTGRTRYRSSFVQTVDTTYVIAGFPYHSTVERLNQTRLHYDDVDGTIQWWVRGARLDVQGGFRYRLAGVIAGGGRWGRVALQVPIVERLAIVGEMGRRLATPEQRLPAYRFASLAVRFTHAPDREREAEPPRALRLPDAPRTEVSSDTSDVQGVVVRGLVASRVELMGDLSDWKPVELTSDGRDTWRYPVRLTVGVHHLLLRVDGGEWAPAPGLPVHLDELDQRVGVLVVEQ